MFGFEPSIVACNRTKKSKSLLNIMPSRNVLDMSFHPAAAARQDKVLELRIIAGYDVDTKLVVKVSYWKTMMLGYMRHRAIDEPKENSYVKCRSMLLVSRIANLEHL